MRITLTKSGNVTKGDHAIAAAHFFDFHPANIGGDIIGSVDIQTLAEFQEISHAWNAPVTYYDDEEQSVVEIQDETLTPMPEDEDNFD